jgi:GMP synthase-like glutamine amidotransferase
MWSQDCGVVSTHTQYIDQLDDGDRHIQLLTYHPIFAHPEYLVTMARTIRIAMLNTDIPVPNVFGKRGTYGNIFHELLSTASQRISPSTKIASTDYDVKKFEYPSSISDFDIILITGSASSAYDDVDWIHKLDAYVLDIYLNHPHVKMFGSCFGHQLICQSLLKAHGVVVEKDPNGWELGVKEIKLTEEFRQTLGGRSVSSEKKLPGGKLRTLPDKMRLQFVHADHVKLPSHSLPDSWIVVGSTQHCAVQGIYQPGRILTYQGHFEFDKFVNTETLNIFGAAWDAEVLRETLEACDAEDDAEVAAEIVLQFLLEGSSGNEKVQVTRAVVGGLLTPPLQE